MNGISKESRLAEFFRRLRLLPRARDFDEAWKQIGETIDQVEDELSGVLNNPAAWRTDGRLYPPQFDRELPFSARRRVRRFRTIGHSVFIGENGAIQIRVQKNNPMDGEVLLSKAGGDGREAMEL